MHLKQAKGQGIEQVSYVGQLAAKPIDRLADDHVEPACLGLIRSALSSDTRPLTATD